MPKMLKIIQTFLLLCSRLLKAPIKLHLLPSLWSLNSGAKGLTVSDILVIISPEVYCCRHYPADGTGIICNINCYRQQ